MILCDPRETIQNGPRYWKRTEKMKINRSSWWFKSLCFKILDSTVLKLSLLLFVILNIVKKFERTQPCILRIIKIHDGVIKWKHFPRYWSFVRGIHRWPVNSPHKGQWHGTLVFSLTYTRIHGWVNNREAGDLRRHRSHYDVNLMQCTSKIYYQSVILLRKYQKLRNCWWISSQVDFLLCVISPCTPTIPSKFWINCFSCQHDLAIAWMQSICFGKYLSNRNMGLFTVNYILYAHRRVHVCLSFRRCPLLRYLRFSLFKVVFIWPP